jgi:hypothetical protein
MVFEKILGLDKIGGPTEGELTKTIESYTSRIPSVSFLGLALGSMVLSGLLGGLTERKHTALFVAQCVPTLLLLGVYNKLVKLEGHDYAHHQVAPIRH